MSDPHHNQHDNGLGFEREDLGPRPVYGFMITLAISGVLVYYAIWGMYHFLDAYERKHQAAKGPMVQYEQDPREASGQRTHEKILQEFPEPRLEDNEFTELNDYRYQEEETLNSSDWLDKSAGTARIPIEQAMKLIAERGLPTNPKGGTLPPSVVSTVNQAAKKADTSEGRKSPAKQQTGKGKSQ
jgi:hypothetical protein